MSDIDGALVISVVAGALRAATPVIYAGLGELINERSGVLNLGLEGLMLTGACAAVGAHLAWGTWEVSLLVAALAAGFVGLIHAFFCVVLRSSQVVTGLAVLFLCQGVTAVVGARWVSRAVSPGLAPPLAGLEPVPVLGTVLGQQDIMVFGALLAAVAVGVFLFRSRWGVLLRACGESAHAAAAAGVRVRAVRLAAGTACGVLCGLGGAHLSLFYAQQWQENMVTGRGWIALVMVIFGMWFPGRLLLGAYLFGGLVTLQLNLQARGIAAPQYVLSMLPFLVTLALLVAASWRLKWRSGGMPADLGIPFHPEGQAE